MRECFRRERAVAYAYIEPPSQITAPRTKLCVLKAKTFFRRPRSLAHPRAVRSARAPRRTDGSFQREVDEDEHDDNDSKHT